MATPITGFRIPDEMLNKAKYIAWFERETLAGRVLALVESDIEKWEKKNGKITSEMITKAIKK